MVSCPTPRAWDASSPVPMPGAAPNSSRTSESACKSMLSVDEAILSRRSVRGFLSDEVPQKVLDEVFEIAQRAPSNCNVQLWVPHVVSGNALRHLRTALVDAGRNGLPIEPDWPADGKFDGVYRQRQVDAAVQLYGAMGVERG